MNLLKLTFILGFLSFTNTQSLSNCEKAGLFSLTINGIPNEDLLNKLKEKRVQVTFFLNEPIQNDNKFILSKAIKDGHEIGILQPKLNRKVNILDFDKIRNNIESNLNIKSIYVKQRFLNEDDELTTSLNNNNYKVINNESHHLTLNSDNMSISNKVNDLLHDKDINKDSFIYSISLTPSTINMIDSFIHTVRENGFIFTSLNKCLNSNQLLKRRGNNDVWNLLKKYQPPIAKVMPIYQDASKQMRAPNVINLDLKPLKRRSIKPEQIQNSNNLFGNIDIKEDIQILGVNDESSLKSSNKLQRREENPELNLNSLVFGTGRLTPFNKPSKPGVFTPIYSEGSGGKSRNQPIIIHDPDNNSQHHERRDEIPKPIYDPNTKHSSHSGKSLTGGRWRVLPVNSDTSKLRVALRIKQEDPVIKSVLERRIDLANFKPKKAYVVPVFSGNRLLAPFSISDNDKKLEPRAAPPFRAHRIRVNQDLARSINKPKVLDLD